jgi:hypothetical protein
MKPSITVLSVCCVLLLVSAAHGTAYFLQATNNWDANPTWTPGVAGYPSTGSDTATLSNNTSGPYTVTVNGDYSYGATTATHTATIAFDNEATDRTLTTTSLTVDAASRAVTLTQTGDAGDLFQITGELTVMSGTDSGEHAEFQLTSADLSFSSMFLDGVDANAKAIIDLNQSVTQSSTDVTVADRADIEIATGKTLTIRDLYVGDNDDAGDDFDGVLTISDGGTVSAASIVVSGETNGSTLTVSSSTLQTS